MRVLATAAMGNSAATEDPVATTSAITSARRHSTSTNESSITCTSCGYEPYKKATYRGSGAAVGKEVGVDEAVDERLLVWLHLVELDAHADAPIAPGDVAFGIDVAFGARHAEPDFDGRVGRQRTGRPDRDAATAQVQCQCRRNRVPESVLDRDSERNRRSAGAIDC